MTNLDRRWRAKEALAEWMGGDDFSDDPGLYYEIAEKHLRIIKEETTREFIETQIVLRSLGGKER